MAIVNRSFSVNVTPGMMPPIIHVSEYDVGRAYTASILDEQGNTFTVPSGTTASIEGTLNGAVGFTQSATGIVTMTITNATVKRIRFSSTLTGAASDVIITKNEAIE